MASHQNLYILKRQCLTGSSHWKLGLSHPSTPLIGTIFFSHQNKIVVRDNAELAPTASTDESQISHYEAIARIDADKVSLLHQLLTGQALQGLDSSSYLVYGLGALEDCGLVRPGMKTQWENWIFREKMGAGGAAGTIVGDTGGASRGSGMIAASHESVARMHRMQTARSLPARTGSAARRTEAATEGGTGVAAGLTVPPRTKSEGRKASGRFKIVPNTPDGNSPRGSFRGPAGRMSFDK